MRNRNRRFRKIFGMGRRQMAFLGGTDQFGNPRVGRSFSQGRGKNKGNKPGSGPGGYCICPTCETKVSHVVNQPCDELNCPQCGLPMIKE